MTLVEPISGSGVEWADDGKLWLKQIITVDVQTRVGSSGPNSGDGVNIKAQFGPVYSLTTSQMKHALKWFAKNPCAQYEGQ